MRHVACTHRAGQSPPDRAGRRGNVEPRAAKGQDGAPNKPPSVSKEDQSVLPAERASRPSVLQVGIASATHRVTHAERSRAPEAPRGRLGLHVRRGQVRGVVLDAHGAAGLRLMARRPRRQTVPSKSERALTPRVARAAVIPSEPNLASARSLGCRPERADALALCPVGRKEARGSQREVTHERNSALKRVHHHWRPQRRGVKRHTKHGRLTALRDPLQGRTDALKDISGYSTVKGI